MPPLRALVVDDAVIMRRLITTVFERAEGIEVAGTAPNGRIALQKLPQVNPDFVTLDVEMPEMNGLETLRALRADYPELPVIMISMATRRGAVITIDALSAGATDYVTKPEQVADVEEAIQRLGLELVPKVKAICRQLQTTAALSAVAASGFSAPLPPRAAPPPPVPTATRSVFPQKVELLCIATSTGGPNALAEVFGGLDRPLSVPVAIVQHMPAEFTRMLAERIDRSRGAVRCVEATDGQVLEPGRAYLAPGGYHLAIERSAGRMVARITSTPPENSCRPAADVLFRTAAEAVGAGVLGVVLTGMGSDGMLGARRIREAGGRILAQDEATSVVWGMPGAVVQAGLAEQILSLEAVAPEILRRIPA